MKQYLKEFSMPEWVIVSNTDIQFPDPNLINKIVNYQLDSTAAIIAPKIIKQTLNGLILENQNPFLKKRPSKTKMLFYVFKNRFFIFAVLYGVLAKFKSEVWSAYRKKEGSCNWMNKEKVCEEIYAPMGAFIIFNRRYFDAGGTLYHEPFLYGEEISIAEEARKLKLKTIYDPNLKITHLAGGTSGNVPSKTRVNYQYQGVRYCYDKYFKSK
jgi:GT2 family glycosyltransferase